MDLPTYRELRRRARRLSKSIEEAEDLVQDTLLAALQAGRSDIEWLAGTLRLQAAMRVRSAVRRRRREAEAAVVTIDSAAAVAAADGIQAHALLKRLPPAARRVATLALHGLNAEEVRWILSISDAAFRQRLTSIRRTLARLPGVAGIVVAEAGAGGREGADELQFGLMRRALKAALLGADGLGTHDGDGHLIVLRPRSVHDAHKSLPCGNK
jgi:DNA-directed RNA polymerase specialized sigma24 family protein